jgi:hypothetical protein
MTAASSFWSSSSNGRPADSRTRSKARSGRSQCSASQASLHPCKFHGTSGKFHANSASSYSINDRYCLWQSNCCTGRAARVAMWQKTIRTWRHHCTPIDSPWSPPSVETPGRARFTNSPISSTELARVKQTFGSPSRESVRIGRGLSGNWLASVQRIRPLVSYDPGQERR